MLETIEPFGVTLLVAAAVVSVALLSNRISTRVRVPAPAIFLLGAAGVSEVLASPLAIQAVEQIVTVALILILFEGGMHIGWRRLRDSVGPVVTGGVVGTFLTVGALAMVAHLFVWLFLAGGPAVGCCAGAD